MASFLIFNNLERDCFVPHNDMTWTCESM